MAKDDVFNIEAKRDPVTGELCVYFDSIEHPARVMIGTIKPPFGIVRYVPEKVCHPVLASEYDGAEFYLHDSYVCSECGCKLADKGVYNTPTHVWFKFCPNCGAKVVKA